MFKKFRVFFYALPFLILPAVFLAHNALAAKAGSGAPANELIEKGMTLWQLMLAGGSCMIFLGLISIAALASVIYHFKYVTPERLTPPEFIENLLTLLEKKEYGKAVSICKQQPNMVSEIALKGLQKMSKGKVVVEEAIQAEGKAKIEGLWNNLSYLGDAAAIAPMLGLLGTILGMIQAFNYQAFKSGIINPVALAQGLAKAMITTAFGLMIAVPVLILYSYFRGRIATITSTTERAASEIVHSIEHKS